ncbi:MAG: GAF domain-containing protein [Bacilli bacterium]|nr:GAF domain-containing protein [Bacilli bacterium]
MLEKQVKAIINEKYPLITNLSNASAVLNTLKDINWAGFYLVKEDGLYLGPFQGEVACSFIPFSKGMCGRCYREKKTVIIDDVTKEKDHIACSSASRSEIVVPIFKGDKVIALIDIDAPIINRFNEKDGEELEKVAKELEILF